MDCKHLAQELKLQILEHGDDRCVATLTVINSQVILVFTPFYVRGLLSVYFPNRIGFTCKDVLATLLLARRQGCTNPGYGITLATTFCIVAPNNNESSVCFWLHVTLLALETSR